MITETYIEKWLGYLKLPADEPTRLRLYIWWGMFAAFLTYLLLAVSAVSQVEPRPLDGGMISFCAVFLGLSGFSLVLGLVTPWLMSLVVPQLSAKPFFNFACQLFWYNACAIFALIIAVVAGRFQLVLWPTLLAFIGIIKIYPRAKLSARI